MKDEALLDKAGEVRAGEELDVNLLRDYLSPILGLPLSDLQITQFPGGFSNLTYLLSSGDDRWVLRRPPFGSKVKSAHDMGREYTMLSALENVFPYAPSPKHFCKDHSLLGCDFYLMSCIEGVVIRKSYPEGMNLSPAQVREQFFTLFDVLGELHSVDLKEAGLENFGRPEGYVRRQVEGWNRRYRDAMTPDAPNFDAIMSWLEDKMPADSGLARIIHNDYKMDNVIWSPDDSAKIVGVLDWEMATVGDPLMDLGCTLGYWVEESDPDEYRQYRAMPSDAPGAPTRAEIVARFSEQTGLEVDKFDFYFCFGMFRLAVIGQQIYYRYYKGLTQDQRFARMIKKVNILKTMCDRVIGQSDL
ncbi:MAG: phosphotransferase family protein [Pseudohongiellaceae bacterium]|nr:phosphotransferase family protein [Pseudohongiellaceae bacterium]